MLVIRRFRRSGAVGRSSRQVRKLNGFTDCSWRLPPFFSPADCSCRLLLIFGICGYVLSIDPVAFVTAHGREVAEPAGLLFLRRPDAEIALAHMVEKVPDLCDHAGSDLLPFIIGHHRTDPVADPGILQRA